MTTAMCLEVQENAVNSLAKKQSKHGKACSIVILGCPCSRNTTLSGARMNRHNAELLLNFLR